MRHAAGLLAFGEVLGLSLLEELTGAGVPDELGRRGLVVGGKDGRRVHLRLAHPLYGEVPRGWTPAHRRRRYCREPAVATRRTGMRRREDLARVGGRLLEAGDLGDPHLLLAAADRAVRTPDFAPAVRPAQAACDAGAGAPARRTLAAALGYAGHGVRAEQVHSGRPQAVTSGPGHLEPVQLRAANLYRSPDRPDDALELLRRTERMMTDASPRAEPAPLQAVMYAAQADWPAYEQAAGRARDGAPSDPRTSPRLRCAESVDHLPHGRAVQARQTTGSVLSAASTDDEMPIRRAGPA